jgi:superfamily I DNA/RNA helicase
LLLSAHSAKGLEFENVIVLGFYNTLNDWYNRDLDELIYVSLTRANSGLFIIRTPDTIEKLRDLKIEEEKKQEVSIDDLFG